MLQGRLIHNFKEQYLKYNARNISHQYARTPMFKRNRDMYLFMKLL